MHEYGDSLMSVETSGSVEYCEVARERAAPTRRPRTPSLTSSAVASRAELDDEVGDRAGRDGRADGDAVELAFSSGSTSADRPRGAGRGRDQVDRGGPRPAQVAVRHVLRICWSFVYAWIVVMNPRSIAEACRSSTFAIGATQFVVHEAFEMMWCCVRVVLVVVDAEHERDVGIGRGRRDDDLLRAGVEVLLRPVAVGEEAGRLDHDVDAEVAPRQRRRVALGEHLHLACRRP